MTSTQFPPAATTYPLSFDTVANSLSFGETSTSLESNKSTLFAQNARGMASRTTLRDTRGRVYRQPRLTASEFRSSRFDFRPLPLPSLSYHQLTNRSSQPSICKPCVFTTLRIPFFANPVFSHLYKSPGGVEGSLGFVTAARTEASGGNHTISTPISPCCFDPALPIHTTLHRVALSGSSFRTSSTTCPRRSRKSTWSRKPPGPVSTTRQGTLFCVLPRVSCVMTRLAGFFEVIRFARRASGRGEVGIVQPPTLVTSIRLTAREDKLYSGYVTAALAILQFRQRAAPAGCGPKTPETT